MTTFGTRSLLAVVLVLGQLAGAWHTLSHTGRHDDVGRPIFGDHVHHADDAHEHGVRDLRQIPPEHDVDHDGALCGLCLLAGVGIALAGAAGASYADDAARGASVRVGDVPPLTRRASHRLARAPPHALS